MKCVWSPMCRIAISHDDPMAYETRSNAIVEFYKPTHADQKIRQFFLLLEKFLFGDVRFLSGSSTCFRTKDPKWLQQPSGLAHFKKSYPLFESVSWVIIIIIQLVYISHHFFSWKPVCLLKRNNKSKLWSPVRDLWPLASTSQCHPSYFLLNRKFTTGSV